MTRLALALALPAALALGCSKADPPPDSAAETAAAAQAQTAAADDADKKAPETKVAEKTAATNEAAKKPPIKRTRADRKAAAALTWPTEIAWVDDWTAARAQSADSGKPIMLVVYADWCPRCKELIPVFTEGEVVEASKGLVMVKADNDEKPDWLMAYADQGTYVPRIFFFGADGNLRTDLTSGHPRYPFFYTPRGKTALLKSMRAAVGG